MLKKLVVSGYMGFADRKELDLAVPSGKPGSGLTVLVGPNNAGKSSIIEVLQLLLKCGEALELKRAQRNAKTNGIVRIEYVIGDTSVRLSVDGPSPAKWERPDDRFTPPHVRIVLSPRAIPPRFSRNQLTRQAYDSIVPLERASQQRDIHFAGRLSSYSEQNLELKRGIERILERSPGWYAEFADGGDRFVRVTSASDSHDATGLGAGVQSVFHLADALAQPHTGTIVAIDEPEFSLHPAAQRRLLDQILEASKKAQIVLATHSPIFVPIEQLQDGARLARVHIETQATTISQLSHETGRQLSILTTDQHNPHVAGLDAREVFFLESGVIVCEGQHDVIAYRNLFRSLGHNPRASFYGWGVGGASKMPLIVDVLSELGIERVYGLLDKGQETTMEELGRKFPNYQFTTIPAVDVLSKAEVRPKAPIKGLLDENRTLRPEHKEATDTLLRQVVEYFDPGSASARR